MVLSSGMMQKNLKNIFYTLDKLILQVKIKDEEFRSYSKGLYQRRIFEARWKLKFKEQKLRDLFFQLSYSNLITTWPG